MSNKLLYPILIVLLFFFGALIVAHSDTNTKMTKETTTILQPSDTTAVPRGPYNDVIGPHEKPAPKPKTDAEKVLI